MRDLDVLTDYLGRGQRRVLQNEGKDIYKGMGNEYMKYI